MTAGLASVAELVLVLVLVLGAQARGMATECQCICPKVPVSLLLAQDRRQWLLLERLRRRSELAHFRSQAPDL